MSKKKILDSDYEKIVDMYNKWHDSTRNSRSV